MPPPPNSTIITLFLTDCNRLREIDSEKFQISSREISSRILKKLSPRRLLDFHHIEIPTDRPLRPPPRPLRKVIYRRPASFDRSYETRARTSQPIGFVLHLINFSYLNNRSLDEIETKYSFTKHEDMKWLEEPFYDRETLKSKYLEFVHKRWKRQREIIKDCLYGECVQ